MIEEGKANVFDKSKKPKESLLTLAWREKVG